MKITAMTELYAKAIETWQYQRPYDLYNMGDEADILEEMMDGSYYAVVENGVLIGFFCYGANAQVNNNTGAYDEDRIDIGLGMKPSLTGAGKGVLFVSIGLEFGKANFNKKMRLTVASFNQRAIKVYKKLGFKEIARFERVGDGQKTGFIIMAD